MARRNSFVNAYNKTPRVGDSVMVHSYKYSGWLYRTWNFPILVEDNDEYIVLCTIDSTVLSSEENSFRIFTSKVTKPTFWFFFKNKWFNLIVTIETHGTKLYINIACPYMYEEGAIKYFDFDLDFKTIELIRWKEIDVNEYFINQQKYHYPADLIDKINETEIEVKELIDKKFFDKFANLNYLSKMYKKYLEIVDEREKKWNVRNSKN
ncbi:MAG: DUF402 domain-containing protein [Ureaplasma sp.]|nr:DUF402 domain-containing protein [Ureaplasma sp.]MDE6289782.1 DUF402 domain-containing protein [Ureaplasma sp.]